MPHPLLSLTSKRMAHVAKGTRETYMETSWDMHNANTGQLLGSGPTILSEKKQLQRSHSCHFYSNVLVT
jgi:hypothetical protein